MKLCQSSKFLHVRYFQNQIQLLLKHDVDACCYRIQLDVRNHVPECVYHFIATHVQKNNESLPVIHTLSESSSLGSAAV